MTATARPGEGTDIQVKISAAFVSVGEVVTVASPSITVDKVEKTNLKSAIKEFRPSRIKEMNDLKFTVNWDVDDATHAALLAGVLAVPATTFDWKIIYTDDEVTAANQTFSGFITQWDGDDIEVGANVQADITICLTTVVTTTQGSGS